MAGVRWQVVSAAARNVAATAATAVSATAATAALTVLFCTHAMGV